MFDKHMICQEGFSNVIEGGEVTGFRFLARLPYYRGLGLSMIEDIAISVNGEAVERSDIRFSVRGRSWSLDELETVYDDRWNFGEKAELIVLRPGGLAAGKHRLKLAEKLRISYLPFVPTTTCEADVALTR